MGGSDPDVAVGDVLYAELPDAVVGLALRDRTETPFAWGEQEDLSFEVLFEVVETRRSSVLALAVF